MSLPGKLDFYRCFHVDLAVVPKNFAEALALSMNQWKTQARAVWLEVPLNRLDLIPICGQQGFYPHHVSSTGVMMASWLAKTPNTLPNYTTHYIGAGGLVFKPHTDDILVIKTNTPLAYHVTWKLPGGLVNKGETISQGALREVQEEVGLQAEAKGILGFRERTDYLFGMNDIYYVLLMTALGQEIKPDMEEVQEARWMNIHEWLQIPEYGPSRMMLQSQLKDCKGPAQEHLERKVMTLHELEVLGTTSQTHLLHHS